MTGSVNFLRNQDRVFAAYRHLAETPGVAGVWHEDRAYFDLPGYYHLHRAIPFYDAITGRDAFVGADGFDLESITGVGHSHRDGGPVAGSVRVLGGEDLRAPFGYSAGMPKNPTSAAWQEVRSDHRRRRLRGRGS